MKKDNLAKDNFNIDIDDSIYSNKDLLNLKPFGIENTTSNKVNVSKRVKSIRQLKNNEKEIVRLNYKQAILKGLGSDLEKIQLYIVDKTKIWIEIEGLEYLKKSEEQEHRIWYRQLAMDEFKYIGIYRKAVDEIEQQKIELWKIFENSKTSQMGKIKSIRELHKLTITSTLLLTDLPFVTRLSKYFQI